MPSFTALASLLFALQSSAAPSGDPASDRDGDHDGDHDGLSDFQEQHKYRTDPQDADSDDDGIPDGDWSERREYAYTVRSVVRVLPPVTPDVLCDDYQDARILDERREYVELEVVHYPLNTVASAIVADPGWRDTIKARKELKPFLEPGLTANWNPKMRDELIAALAKDGIDVAKLDDKTLVERASKWLFQTTKFVDGFTTYCSTFDRDGKPGGAKGKARVLPGLEAAAERGKNEKGLTIEEQWDRELYAAGMWKHRLHGSCTSSAIFVDGCLRALGIPTRIVLFMPLVDGSDPREVGWLATHLTNHAVRRTVRRGIEPLGDSWANHTFNEVFVGGRWRRLNYSVLGQNILDAGYFGLMTHVATFNDWSDGEMARTWGLRQGTDRKPDDPFGGSNPYSCIDLSDQFGAHAQVDNPEPAERTTLAIASLHWWSSPERTVAMTLDDPETAGHLVFRVDEPIDGADCKEFYDAVDHAFVLRASGQPDVPAQATRGYWVDGGGVTFYLRIEPESVASMAVGVPYALVPQNGSAGGARPRQWLVGADVTIVRAGAKTPFATGERASGPGSELAFTLDAARWSDDPKLPKFVHEALPGEPRLLARVVGWKEWSQVKELTTAGDTRFFLEADGHPTLKIGVDPGGFTWKEEGRTVAWVVFPLGGGDWRDFAKDVEYRLRPQNSKKGYRWIVKAGVVAPPRS